MTNNRYVKLLLPIYFQNIMLSLKELLDVYVSSYYSDNVVAIIGLSDKVFNIVNILISIIVLSSCVLMNQFIGANDKEKFSNTLSVSLSLSLILGIFITLVFALFSHYITVLLVGKSEMYENVRIYLTIVGAGYLFYCLMLVIAPIFSYWGKPKITLIINLISVIALIFGYLVLLSTGVQNENDGILGIAICFFFSYLVGGGVALCCLRNFLKKNNIKFSFCIKKEYYGDFLKVGLPSIGENFSYNLSQLFISLLSYRMDIVYLTAQLYASNIMNLVSRCSYSYGQTMSIVVGNYVGRERQNEVYSVCLRAIRNAICLSLPLIICTILFSNRIIGLFTNNETIIQTAKIIMIIEGLTILSKTFNFILGESLRASGDVFFPFLVAICSMWIVNVGGAYLGGYVLKMGIWGICISSYFEETIRAFVFTKRWVSKKWMKNNIVKSIYDTQQ